MGPSDSGDGGTVRLSVVEQCVFNNMTQPYGQREKLRRNRYGFEQLRSALDRIDELEASNSHLTKRLEKMKANRSALLAQQ